MEFIQIVEFDSDRPDDVQDLMRQWQESARADSGPSRVTVVKDRENPKRFRTIVEFPSYEQAMAYSGRPETDSFANRMRQLATDGPRFVNLDVLTRDVPAGKAA